MQGKGKEALKVLIETAGDTSSRKRKFDQISGFMSDFDNNISKELALKRLQELQEAHGKIPANIEKYTPQVSQEASVAQPQAQAQAQPQAQSQSKNSSARRSKGQGPPAGQPQVIPSVAAPSAKSAPRKSKPKINK